MITDSDYGKTWDLSRCSNCTHVFANPCPTQDLIQSLYEDIEDPAYQEESRGRSKNFKRILKYLDKRHPERGRLFDVGAATGILLEVSKKRGWDVDGIEPSTWAVRTARDKYNITIREGAFEKAALSKEYYKVVTMVDFIEHIPHPLDAMSVAQKILLPGGTLCLVTPDIYSLAARVFGQKWWHYRPGHLAYFSRKSLDYLLQRAGFRIVKTRRYSWSFSLHYLISRRSALNFLLKPSVLASLWKKIPIKLALRDSFEIYAIKEM
jgi:SAM-dependent methyltransferase